MSTGASAFCIDVGLYESCRIAGAIERLVVDPAGGSLEVTLTDGTARVRARWRLPAGATRGFACGRRITVEGVALQGPDGQPLLEEPTVQLVVGELR